MGFFSGALGETFRPWFERLPTSVRGRLRSGLQRWPVVARLLVSTAGGERLPGTVRFGSLRRTVPFSRDWGYDRGTPIDRVYIDEFLARHADDVRGACLEVMNADYTDRFGGARVSRRDVLDINPANALATIVADLGEADSLPVQRFDCVIFTQTLHLIPDMPVALANVWEAIAPGGVLLLTVPALGRHDTRKGFHHDRWRVTKTGLEWLLAGLPDARADTTTYGNVLSCTAFLYGLAAEELRPEELHVTDPEFPLIVATRVHKEPIQ
jgi:SAM-dependent methyltransferase